MKGNNAREFVKFQNIRGISVASAGIPETFPDHWHSAAEFILATKNYCKILIDDEEIVLMKGDVFLSWPRQHHSIVEIPKNGAVLVQFASGLIENNLDLISLSTYIFKYHKLELAKDPEITTYVTEKIRFIKNLYENKEFFSESKCKIAICEMVLKIGEFVLKENAEELISDFESDPIQKRMHEALAFIDEHATENITQNDVADAIGLSPFYFSRLFKKHAGKSFPNYLAEVRIRIATGLLADGSMSITEVAFQAGFQSITAFNKVFRTVVGCTPREYRKLNIHSKHEV